MVGHAVIAALGRIDARHGSHFLSELERPGLLALLADGLASTDEDVRRSAVIALGYAGDAESQALVVDRLNDKSRRLQDAASEALVHMGERSLAPLLALFADPASDHRPLLARILADVGSGEVVGPLIGGLSDPAGPVRCLRGIAGQYGRLECGRPSNRAHVEDPDPAVRRAAAGALGKLRHLSAARSLLAALSDPANEVRREAAEAVAHVGARQIVNRLAGLLSDTRTEVREAAIQRSARCRTGRPTRTSSQPSAVPTHR